MESTTIDKHSRDLIVFSTEDRLGQAEVDRIAQTLREKHPDGQFLVVDSGAKLEQLSDADLARAGLVRVPHDAKVVIVTDQLIERVRAEADDEGWSPARTIQVSIPPENGLLIDPCFRYVAEA